MCIQQVEILAGGQNMKRIWKNKEGVSPVIATILMVAITVVLAAVLYVMVSGYMSGGGGQQVTGSINVDTAGSEISNGNATLLLTITVPNEPKVADITVKVFDGNTDVTTSFTIDWIHVASDSGDNFVKTGDKLSIAHNTWGTDIDNYKVSITVQNYDGTIERTL
jgi:flagellin-like protein